MSEFPLSPATDATSLFEMRIPRGAEVINCALFICPPAVWPAGAAGSIVNFGECAYANRVFDVRDFRDEERLVRFDLKSLERVQSPGSCEQQRPDYGAQPPVPMVSGLELGCVAFNNRSVIRSTRLLELTPTQLPQFARLPVEDCSRLEQGAEDRLCISRGTGRCLQGSCVRESEDAGANPTAVLGRCSAETEGLSCTPEAELGSCAQGECVPVRLRSLSGTDFTGIPLVIGDCAVENDLTDGHNCFPSVFGGYGTCRERQCRARCTDVRDCKFDTRANVELTGACVRQSGSDPWGLCFPEAPDAG